MKYLNSVVALAFSAGVMLFSACSDNNDEPKVDEPENPAETETHYNVSLTLTDNGFDLGNGDYLAVPAAEGDKAGLFVVKDGAPIVENVELTFDGEAWKAATAVSELGDRYMVYRPYRADVSVDVAADDAAGFFASLLSSGDIPGVDQSDYESSVLPCDIIYAEAIVSGSKTEVLYESLNLTATASHSLAATGWSLPGGTTYTTSTGFSYTTPGAAVAQGVKLGTLDVNPAVVNGNPVFFYPAGSGDVLTVAYTYQNNDKTAEVTLDGEAGTVTVKAIEGGSVDGGQRDLAVGDLYYCDGSVLPVEMLADMNEAPAGVAGVVFCVDPARFSAEETELLGEVHALVISAKMGRNEKDRNPETNAYVKWCDGWPKNLGDDGDGRFIDSVEDPAYPGLVLPLIEDRTDYVASYEVNNADLKGYSYNSMIRIRRAAEIAAGYYFAFSAIDNLSSNVPVNTLSTTGWYIPAVGQMLDVMRNLGKANANASTVQKFIAGESCDFNFAPDQTLNLTANLDASMAKISKDEKDTYAKADYAIWTSSYTKVLSSYTGTYMPGLREVVFDSDVLSVFGYDVIGQGNVRGVLAF